MIDYQERVIAEKDNLAQKIVDLAAFLISETFRNLHEEDKALLTEQLKLMADYHYCLIRRIRRFVPTEV